MAWYEILTLSIFVGVLFSVLIYGLIWDVQRIKAMIQQHKKATLFYEQGAEFFHRCNTGEIE